MKDTSLNSSNTTQDSVLSPMDASLEDVLKKDALIRVRRTVLGQEETEDRYVNIRPFITTPAQITVAGSRTVNLGNYESAKIHVSLTLPCYKEEITEALKFATDFVDAELNRRLEECSSSMVGAGACTLRR